MKVQPDEWKSDSVGKTLIVSNNVSEQMTNPDAIFTKSKLQLYHFRRSSTTFRLVSDSLVKQSTV